MGSTWLDIVSLLTELLAPVFAGLLAWLSARVISFIKAKVSNETYSGMLTRLTDSVFTLVREAEQTVVAELKRAKSDTSPGGARLTKDEAAQVKAAVLGKFKVLWGPEGLRELMEILGLTSETVDEWLSAKIEEAVHVEKRGDPSVSLRSSAP